MALSLFSIMKILPHIRIFYRLHDLLDERRKKARLGQMLISIEKEHGKREFCEIDYPDLERLYDQVPRCERSLYEIIPENHRVKAYIDFEYQIDNNRLVDQTKAIDSCLKVLYTVLNHQSQNHSYTDVSLQQVLEQFLVLQA
jgi:hypothetical protein